MRSHPKTPNQSTETITTKAIATQLLHNYSDRDESKLLTDQSPHSI